MPMEQVTYEFPHEKDGEMEGVDVEIELEPSSAETVQVPGRKTPENPLKKKASTEEDVSDVGDVSDDDDDDDIEVIDDTPEEDRNREPAPPPEDVTDEELESYSDRVRQRIKHFAKGYHDERREKEKALRERQELEVLAKRLLQENQSLKGNVGKSRAALLEQAKRTITGQFEQAKREYLDAYESGDGDKVLAAQQKLNDLQSKKQRLEAIKPETLQRSSGHVQGTQVPSNQSPPQRQPAPQPTVDPKAQEWANQNPWWGKDEEMTSFALGVHQKLIKDGVDAGSDDYYKRLNNRLREVFPDQLGVKEARQGEARRSNNVVAAPSRSQSSKKVRLTKTQLALAKRLGLTPKQYATQLAKEMKNG